MKKQYVILEIRFTVQVDLFGVCQISKKMKSEVLGFACI